MSDNEEVTIRFKIAKSLYKKLQEQLEALKEKQVQGLEEAETVEDLVKFYLEQFSAGEEQMKKINDRMHSVLETLKEKGIDIMDLFNTFSDQIKEEEEKMKNKQKEKENNEKDKPPEKKKS